MPRAKAIVHHVHLSEVEMNWVPIAAVECRRTGQDTTTLIPEMKSVACGRSQTRSPWLIAKERNAISDRAEHPESGGHERHDLQPPGSFF